MKNKELSLAERFNGFIETKNLFTKDETILLAVSGGMDSMVMAALYSKCGYKFAIAHCNFSMRGDESDGDETAVQKAAENYSVPYHKKQFDTISFAENNK